MNRFIGSLAIVTTLKISLLQDCHNTQPVNTLQVKDCLERSFTTERQTNHTRNSQTELRVILRPDFYYCQTVAGLLMWGALSDERTGLSFTVALGPRRADNFGSESRGTCGHNLLSQIRDFPFRRLVRLAGLRWRYSVPLPRGSV
jgi:hypothetical protein